MSVTPAAWQPSFQPQAWLTYNVRTSTGGTKTNSKKERKDAPDFDEHFCF
jgi:hypothetical protein